MASSSSSGGASSPQDLLTAERRKNYRNWLIGVFGLLLATVLTYTIMHANIPGGQNILLKDADQSMIRNILDGEKDAYVRDSTQLGAQIKALAKKLENTTTGDTVKLAAELDSLHKRKHNLPTIIPEYREFVLEYIFRMYPPRVAEAQDTALVDKASLEFFKKLCENSNGGKAMTNAQKEMLVDWVHKNNDRNQALIKMVWSFERSELEIVLAGLPVSARSYFWLDGNLKFLEISIWALVGVIINLLYHGTNYMSKKTFETSEVYVHLAKIIYTPITAFIIVGTVEYLAVDEYSSLKEYTSGKGLIVISFLLGFSSGGTIMLLQRITQSVFPSVNSSGSQEKVLNDDAEKYTAEESSSSSSITDPEFEEDEDETGFDGFVEPLPPSSSSSSSSSATIPSSSSSVNPDDNDDAVG